MYGSAVDQDINCRIVGRCIHGGAYDANLKRSDNQIDSEIGDLVDRTEPPVDDLGRQFIYARYNAELSKRWLTKRGLGDIEPAKVAQLDSIDAIPDLIRVGEALAEEVKIEHFCLDRFGQFY
jgi:hypothetical protein